MHEFPYSILFVGLITTGEERAYGKFIFSYAVQSDLHFQPDQVAIIDSVFWACFTAGRGFATAASFFFHPLIVIVLCIIINVLSIITLSVCGSVYPLVTWIGCGLFGASAARSV